MEAWLSEMEMAWNDDPMQSHNNVNEQYYYQENQEMDTLNEELIGLLGDDDLCFTNVSSLFDECTPPKNPITTNLPCHQSTLLLTNDQQIHRFSDSVVVPTDKNNHLYNTDNFDYSPDTSEPIVVTKDEQVVKKHPKSKKSTSSSNKKCVVSEEERGKIGGRKRKRDPIQVHGHIMAERKRRELLTQRFIALSALVPDLKKVDKQSILEEAIKHLRHLNEKVKELEEATTKQLEGSIKNVKRTQLIIDDNNNNSNKCIAENGSGSTYFSDGSSGGDGRQSDGLTEIQVKVERNTILLKICCTKRKGILAKIYNEVERRGMVILNTGVIPFGSSALDISVFAQMKGSAGKEAQVKELLRSLHSVL